jgi:DNA-binding CsgD family transcriptional regulator
MTGNVPIPAIGQLYRSASYLHHEQYRTWALRSFDCLFAADAALWATGPVTTPGPMDYSKALLVSLPPDFADTACEAGDPLQALARDGGPLGFIAGSFRTADLAPPVRARYERYGIRGGVYVRYTNKLSGIANVIATFSFRNEPDALTAEQARALEGLAYAVIDAASFCFFLHLSKAAGFEKRKAAAICDANGLLIECQPKFLALLKEAYPHWTGPLLPFAAAGATRDQKIGGDLFMNLERCERLHIVRIWKPTELDELTTREEELVAHALAGLSDKEIASALGLSASTVSNRLTGAFRKLCVGGRQHLRRKYLLAAV